MDEAISIPVEPESFECRDCGSAVEVIDLDDAYFVIECTECGHETDVTPDALGEEFYRQHAQLLLERR